MALNEPYALQLEFDLKEFEGGSYADLTYQVTHRMIKVGPGILRPLYKSLVSVLSNTAPYVKSLSKDSSECIFSLIKMFSNPDILKKREETSRILSNLFEAVNYILLYHDEGNEEFLVSLIKYRDVLKINDLKLINPQPNSSESVKLKEEEKQAPQSSKPESKKQIVKEAKQMIEPENNEPKKEQTETSQNTSEADTKSESETEVKKDSELEEKEATPEEKEATPDEKEVKPQEKIEENQAEAGVVENKPEQESSEHKNSETEAQEQEKPEKETKETVEEDNKKEEAKLQRSDSDTDNMVDVPLDEIKHQENDAAPAGPHEQHRFLSEEWEKEWKKSLNLPNIKQAITYTDDKARAFLAKNPSPDNNIDADKFVEFLKKSSLKGLLPNQVKILVTTYSGNNSIDTWAISYIWGQVFMRQQEVPLFNVEAIKMFKVNYVNHE